MKGDTYNNGPSCDNSGGHRGSISKLIEIRPGMRRP